jgi:hypothetical protein
MTSCRPQESGGDCTPKFRFGGALQSWRLGDAGSRGAVGRGGAQHPSPRLDHKSQNHRTAAPQTSAADAPSRRDQMSVNRGRVRRERSDRFKYRQMHGEVSSRRLCMSLRSRAADGARVTPKVASDPSLAAVTFHLAGFKCASGH